MKQDKLSEVTRKAIETPLEFTQTLLQQKAFVYGYLLPTYKCFYILSIKSIFVGQKYACLNIP